MNRCNGLFGTHKFQPRYDRGAMDADKFSNLSIKGMDAVVAAVHAARTKTYVYDICIKCGQIVNRGTP